jgi:hypothetical protein
MLLLATHLRRVLTGRYQAGNDPVQGLIWHHDGADLAVVTLEDKRDVMAIFGATRSECLNRRRGAGSAWHIVATRSPLRLLRNKWSVSGGRKTSQPGA